VKSTLPVVAFTLPPPVQFEPVTVAPPPPPGFPASSLGLNKGSRSGATSRGAACAIRAGVQ
jgi:hypothetical protein